MEGREEVEKSATAGERQHWEKEREDQERKEQTERELWEAEQQDREKKLKLKEQKQHHLEERYTKEE